VALPGALHWLWWGYEGVSNGSADDPGEDASTNKDAGGAPSVWYSFGGCLDRETEGCSRDETSDPVKQMS